MALKTITIKSILGGQSPTKYFAGKGQFETSIGIDPDLPVDFGDSFVKTGGVITPAAYADFTGALHTDAAKWIMTSPKTTLVYTYLDDGKFNSYNNIFGSETNIGTPTSGAGNGAAYYNNYIYLATPTDLSRYGPLNNSPTLTNTVWTGATLGSLTPLTNTSYPVKQAIYPNHSMHAHVDGKLYFCDFKDGQGLIHYVKTIISGGGVEGADNDTSVYNALDLPFGYMPTDIASWGNDLAILAIQTSDTELKQGPSALFLWDTFSPSFYRQIDIPDPLATAVFNDKGRLFVFSGNIKNGYQISQFVGGFTLEPLFFSEEGTSPFPGAVDAYGSRLIWGHTTTYPEASASVLSMGYKSPQMPRTAIHNIMRTSSTGSIQVVTALKYLQQAPSSVARVIASWEDTSNRGIDKLSAAATQDSIWRSTTFNIGQPFRIIKINYPLSGAIAGSQTITPKLLIDDEGTTKTLKIINSTNYANNERNIVQYPDGANGRHNFSLQLEFTGTDVISVVLPITIEIETFEING